MRTEAANEDGEGGKSRRIQGKTHFTLRGFNRLCEGENGGRIKRSKRRKEGKKEKRGTKRHRQGSRVLETVLR